MRRNPVRPLSISKSELARIQAEIDSKLTNRGRDVRDAARRYTAFTGHDEIDLTKVKIPAYPRVVFQVGQIDGVLYSTVRDGIPEKYIHKFKKNCRPLFCVSPDGKQLLMIGGLFDFTERGIVDKT